MLTDEVKWLAVTHKSFDHGRRGYNDRLAFFGITKYSAAHDGASIEMNGWGERLIVLFIMM